MRTDSLLPEEVAKGKSYLIISNNRTKHVLPFANIIRCEARRVYTIVFLVNKEQEVYTRNIGKVYTELDCLLFFQIHKSHIINMCQVKTYLPGRGGFVLMNDGSMIRVAQRSKTEFLNAYNEFCKKILNQPVG